MSTTAESRRGAVEIRSIDYVPVAERHGRLWHLGPLSFPFFDDRCALALPANLTGQPATAVPTCADRGASA